MVDASIFGSRTAERILLFLGINEEGYPSEVARVLNLPLSVAQRHLQRLEKVGLLVPIRRGPLRLFRFNPRYPLVAEVRALIEKAVVLLPEAARAAYAIRQRPRSSGKPL